MPIDRLIQRLKYRGQTALAKPLGFALADVLSPAGSHGLSWPSWPQTLIAMPLSSRRLQTRGFNQSALIANAIAQRLAIPVDNTLLSRPNHGAAQAGLSLRARRSNLKRAFTASADVAGQRIALVDDVMTSGATLQAAASALRQAGAASVINLVAARTPFLPR